MSNVAARTLCCVLRDQQTIYDGQEASTTILFRIKPLCTEIFRWVHVDFKALTRFCVPAFSSAALCRKAELLACQLSHVRALMVSVDPSGHLQVLPSQLHVISCTLFLLFLFTLTIRLASPFFPFLACAGQLSDHLQPRHAKPCTLCRYISWHRGEGCLPNRKAAGRCDGQVSEGGYRERAFKKEDVHATVGAAWKRRQAINNPRQW